MAAFNQPGYGGNVWSSELKPYDDSFSDCRGAERLKARVQTEGPLWTYGSVVDRTSQDPRTVLPVLRPTGAGQP